MKITIESTTRIVEASGIQCRLWEGTTERGVKVQVLIPRIAAFAGEDLSQFDDDLQQHRAPQAVEQAFPLRMIL